MMSLRSPQSLRARLLWFLLVAISLTAVAQGLVAYHAARAEADEIFDFQMQQMATSLRSGLPTPNAPTSGEESDDKENFDFVVQVWAADGSRVFPAAEQSVLPKRTPAGFSEVNANGITYRAFSMQSNTQIIQVAQDLGARQEMASTLALRTVAPIALMAPLLMLVVWWVVSVSLAPVARVQRQVAAREVDDLSEVSEAGLPGEIRPLVRELNLLFGRVRVAFDAQTSFVSDAAHELRSPLAALKLQATGIRRARDDATRHVALDRLTAGIDRTTRLVEQLLALARQQASAATGVKPHPVALAEIVRVEVVEATPVATARRIDLGLGQADESKISAHSEAIRVLVRNLLENAIKYTPPGGRVDAEIHRVAQAVVLRVEDSGPGIPPADRARVLDRFYRVPGTETTGSGLGLAIVKSIVDLHHATMILDRSPQLGGLMVEVSFPLQG
jgi:two-component system OmpR family sensor kinase